jgi:acyl-CoA thioesterase YciA
MEYQLCYKVIPMPCDTNFNGDIFGGWVISQMDLAGVSLCSKLSFGRYVTISIDKMIFKKPIKVGDIIEIMGKINKIGNTSISIDIEVQTTNMETGTKQKVTEGLFKYVKIDKNQTPTKIYFKTPL